MSHNGGLTRTIVPRFVAFVDQLICVTYDFNMPDRTLYQPLYAICKKNEKLVLVTHYSMR
jgi:hypothetical protein